MSRVRVGRSLADSGEDHEPGGSASPVSSIEIQSHRLHPSRTEAESAF